MNKQPEQTARTKKKMIDAFWELAGKHGLDKVTISAITKKSGFNRGTFYVYFQDMDDLLEQAEAEIIHDIRSKLCATLEQEGLKDLETVSKIIVDTYAMYDDKLFVIIGKHGDPHFIDKIRREDAIFFRDFFHQTEHIEYVDYIMAYITSALMGLLNYWYDTGKKISVEELVKIIYSFLTKGLFGMVDIETLIQK